MAPEARSVRNQSESVEEAEVVERLVRSVVDSGATWSSFAISLECRTIARARANTSPSANSAWKMLCPTRKAWERFVTAPS